MPWPPSKYIEVYGVCYADAVALNDGLPLGEGVAARYSQHRQNASWRGVPWELTFPEWLGVWTASGHLERRGRGVGEYVMARHGDLGPYKVGNVAIVLASENTAEAQVRPRPSRALVRIGKGKGYTFDARRPHNKKPYLVRCSGEYLGCYATEAEASRAYLAAVNRRLAAQPQAEEQGA